MKMLPPLCIASFALLCASCGPTPRENANAAEIRSLKEDVKDLQEKVTKAEASGKNARETLQEFRDDSDKKQRKNTADKDAAEKKLQEVQKAFDAYRAKYRVTARAVGQKFALINAGGHDYKNVIVTAVTPGELHFHHDSGLAKVPLGVLDTKLRDHFDYDAMEAETWLAANTKTALQKEDSGESDDDSKEGKALAQFHARGGFRSLAAAGQSTSGGASTAGAKSNQKARYQAELNTIYTRARELQADQNCCPVHKRYQLASWQKEASELKKRMAGLP